MGRGVEAPVGELGVKATTVSEHRPCSTPHRAMAVKTAWPAKKPVRLPRVTTTGQTAYTINAYVDVKPGEKENEKLASDCGRPRKC